MQCFFQRTEKNCLNSTFIDTQEKLMEQEILHIKISKPHHVFLNEEIVETMPTTTQQSIPPFHPTLTTPQKNIAFPQTTKEFTVKPSVTPK